MSSLFHSSITLNIMCCSERVATFSIASIPRSFYIDNKDVYCAEIISLFVLGLYILYLVNFYIIKM